MGRVLAHNLVQHEHRERQPISAQRKFEAIAGAKLLDANREPRQSAPKPMVAHHVSEKSMQSSPKCRGLFFVKEDKWDQMWLLKWFNWYSYVLAFTRKAFDFTISTAKGISETLRAENAKTAWSS